MEEVPNLRLIKYDASLIEEVFDYEIDKLYLNFSDPWPKNRHENRRLTSKVFLEKYQNIFKDRKEFTGSLFAQMEAVYDYIDFRNQTHSTFEKLYRIDNRDYPEVAVREALLNCLVHSEDILKKEELGIIERRLNDVESALFAEDGISEKFCVKQIKLHHQLIEKMKNRIMKKITRKGHFNKFDYRL